MENLFSWDSITNSKIVDTTIEDNNHLNTQEGEPFLDATLYKQLIESLVYLTITRLDVSYVVHIVCQFMVAPWSSHYATILRFVHYLIDIMFYEIISFPWSLLTLYAYLDANWVGDSTYCESTTEHCFLLSDSLISLAQQEIDCYCLLQHRGKIFHTCRHHNWVPSAALSSTVLQDLGVDWLFYCDSNLLWQSKCHLDFPQWFIPWVYQVYWEWLPLHSSTFALGNFTAMVSFINIYFRELYSYGMSLHKVS